MKSADININDERDIRLHKLNMLREENINPFPTKSNRTHTTKKALDENHDVEVTIAGRLMVKREIGKLTFCHIMDESGQIQCVFKKDEMEADSYTRLVKKIDSGDIIEVCGVRFVTHKGEESILAKSWNILTKSLLPLPDKFHGLQNEELRIRKRYLDLLVNKDAKEKILTRSRLVHALREFMHDKGFIEVETPILETVASGAMAKTFDTYLNAYDMPVHLRIAIEIPQKRLLVAGFEKIFEIGKCFRNEGVDYQHNPEFTQIEYYWAYADYEDNMRLHEELLPYIIKKAVGSLTIEHEGHTIDFTPPYPRITFRDAVLEYSGIDIDSDDTREKLAQAMQNKGFDIEPHAEFGKLADTLYKATARQKIIQPTFVLNYPAELKPLAKKATDPRYTEMFQLVVNGFELSNSYTELNDPIDQKERFEEQMKHREGGDDEAMAMDHDFVEALEHGMPPATGTGIGIDRLSALITGSHALREVIIFPTIRPAHGEVNKEIET